MGKRTQTQGSLGWILLGGCAFAIGLGCAGSLSGFSSYEYFATPDRDDLWSDKIEHWQSRERAERRAGAIPDAAPASVAGAGAGDAATAGAESLQVKYDAFRSASRRALARELAEWIQLQSRQHYVPDDVVDDWATLDATLRSNGDDCDGLELLTFSFLRELGFGDHEVYRAIVYRRSDGQHHMVTLWFEDPDDPWVIDPTGAMTTGMPRMSDLPEWVPLKVFSQDEEFTVRGKRVAQRLP